MHPWSTAVIALISVSKSDITICSDDVVFFFAAALGDDVGEFEAQLFDVDFGYLHESASLIVAAEVHGSQQPHFALLAAA